MARILVVDDEITIHETVKKALEPLRLDVDAISDGRRALYQIGQETYALLIVDLVMPTKTGYDLVTSLRGQGFSFPIVVLSAHVTTDIRRELGRYTNVEFLSKPFKPAELQALVKRLLPQPAAPRT